MKLVYRTSTVEIWAVQESYGMDYYVYGVTSSPRVCPSLDMARSVAASAE